MNNLQERVKKLLLTLNKLKLTLKLDEKKKKLIELEKKSKNLHFWDNPLVAKEIMQELGDLKNEITALERSENDLQAVNELLSGVEIQPGLAEEVEKIEKKINSIKFSSLFSGKYDLKNAIVSIHAGQGGTEAMDWVSMLYRMYLRYCEKRRWPTNTIEQSEGEEAGIKSITFKVEGQYAYGYLKGEVGTHRLVRQSPFNADNLRQTSFALVGVLPELAEIDLPDIKIKDSDLEWHFFRSSSQGGQNVQKVSTAVRVKHAPTGIVVSAQTQRFQEQNRKIALDLLRAKLWVLEQERKNAQVKQIKGEFKPASWGYQIRSYVLHPYKMVKDLRTGVKTENVDAVLAGELDQFIEAELKTAV